MINVLWGWFRGIEWRIIDGILLPMPLRWDGDDN